MGSNDYQLGGRLNPPTNLEPAHEDGSVYHAYDLEEFVTVYGRST
jgi:hypothetical protein